MCSPFTQDDRMYGPVPMGLSEAASSPPSAVALGGKLAALPLAIFFRKIGSGFSVTILMVSSSTWSIRAMPANGSLLARCFSWLRFQLYSTALPLKGSPLWNLTFFRSLKMYVVLSTTSQDSARRGLMFPWASRRRSGSIAEKATFRLLTSGPIVGSSVLMSVGMPMVSVPFGAATASPLKPTPRPNASTAISPAQRCLMTCLLFSEPWTPATSGCSSGARPLKRRERSFRRATAASLTCAEALPVVKPSPVSGSPNAQGVGPPRALDTARAGCTAWIGADLHALAPGSSRCHRVGGHGGPVHHSPFGAGRFRIDRARAASHPRNGAIVPRAHGARPADPGPVRPLRGSRPRRRSGRGRLVPGQRRRHGPARAAAHGGAHAERPELGRPDRDPAGLLLGDAAQI